jgi:hypothetical protein
MVRQAVLDLPVGHHLNIRQEATRINQKKAPGTGFSNPVLQLMKGMISMQKSAGDWIMIFTGNSTCRKFQRILT